MYPSDYVYATSGGSTTDRTACLNTAISNWDNSSVSDCKDNDWLFDGRFQWTLSPFVDLYEGNANLVFSVYYTGTVANNISYTCGVRPVVYLLENVKISSGTGSESDPFVFEG